MKATYQKYTLNFKRPGGTSRGVLTTKETWFLKIEKNGKIGIGECGIFRGLSSDDRPDYEEKLQCLCNNITRPRKELLAELIDFPSIQFGLEMALQSAESQHPFVLFPSKFTQGEAGIAINGLIWMGDKDFMKAQIEEKLAQGFRCIKLKIGAIDFENELALLRYIRQEFSAEEIELRVDANGAFSPSTAIEKLQQLSQYDIHSIEQPIKQGQFETMATLCQKTPLPIALDEELIGVVDKAKKKELLQTIQPQYIILKPSLVGGFQSSQEWIDLAEKMNIGWWITSALESNVGLNAIAQWAYKKQTSMPQGLGTGGLFSNNIESPLNVKKQYLMYNPNKHWETKTLY